MEQASRRCKIHFVDGAVCTGANGEANVDHAATGAADAGLVAAQAVQYIELQTTDPQTLYRKNTAVCAGDSIKRYNFPGSAEGRSNLLVGHAACWSPHR